jgi:putative copper resistance protein D
MPIAEALVTWIHITCSSIWVGGSIFLGIILAPALKIAVPIASDRLLLMIKFGRRFNSIAIPSFVILIGTGIYNSRSFLVEDILWQTPYGQLLLVKMILVIVVIAAYTFHVRVVSKETEQKLATTKVDEMYINRLRSKIIILGRMIVVLSVAILFLASLLNSGGF